MQSNIFIVQKNIAPASLFHYTLGPSESFMQSAIVMIIVYFLARNYPLDIAPKEVSRV